MFGFLILSVSAVVQDREFEWGLRGVITWIALLTITKALFYIWFPKQMESMQRRCLRLDKPSWTRCIGGFMLLAFVFLSWSVREML
jgi:hypothetical protein